MDREANDVGAPRRLALQLEAAYEAAIRDNPLYPYESDAELKVARKRRRRRALLSR